MSDARGRYAVTPAMRLALVAARSVYAVRWSTLPRWEHFLEVLPELGPVDPVDVFAHAIATLIDDHPMRDALQSELSIHRLVVISESDEELAQWAATFPRDVQVRVDWWLERLAATRALAPAVPMPPTPPGARPPTTLPGATGYVPPAPVAPVATGFFPPSPRFVTTGSTGYAGRYAAPRQCTMCDGRGFQWWLGGDGSMCRTCGGTGLI